jgi:hypothetical protein
MHLKRVIVPDFRVLKDIDITFEPDLVPRIFPLGSLNGGWKSTLLQLIFTLLHCTGNPVGIPYLQNMLDGFEIGWHDKRDLATIEININDKDIKLLFFCCTEKYISAQLKLQFNNIHTRSGTVDADVEWMKKKHFYVCELNRYHKNIFLICNFDIFDSKELMSCLMRICSSIFFAAPITQIFRFLDKSDRELLFKGGDESYKYYSQIKDTKSKLSGFFAYDILAVDLLIKAFITARDNDFRAAISNGGGLQYGDSYQQLFKDLEHMLVDKRVNIDANFTGVCIF